MMTNPVDVVLAAIAAVEQRDAAQLLALYHDDIEFHDAPSLPYGGVVQGKDAVRAHMYGATSWLTTWGPLQPTDAERSMSPVIVAAANEAVVTLYRQRALSTCGERFDGPVLGLYHVRDGKMVRSQMFHYDTAAIASFLSRARDSAG
jgi:ketosteroid isomerase-like protein